MKEIDFDHNSPEHVHEAYRVYRELRANCPVAHTESYGGFWVISGYDEVFEVARDDFRVSSAGSCMIPMTDVGRLPPIMADPPKALAYSLPGVRPTFGRDRQ